LLHRERVGEMVNGVLQRALDSLKGFNSTALVSAGPPSPAATLLVTHDQRFSFLRRITELDELRAGVFPFQIVRHDPVARRYVEQFLIWASH
jgi:hypothetical protein